MNQKVTPLFLKRVRINLFSRFCLEAADVCTKAGLEAEATELLRLQGEISKAQSHTRKNGFTVVCEKLIDRLKGEVASVAKTVEHYRDEEERKVWDAYCYNLSGRSKIGMKEYTAHVESFLATVDDTDCSDTLRNQMEAVRQALKSYNAARAESIRQRDEIKGRRSAASYRAEAQTMVERVWMQLNSLDRYIGSPHAISLQNVLNEYHSYHAERR